MILRGVVLLATLCLLLMPSGGVAGETPPTGLLAKLGLPSGPEGVGGLIEKDQTDLAWIGLFSGSLDGKRSKELTDAILSFQRGIGADETGTLNASQRRELAQRREAIRDGARLVSSVQEWTGTKLLVPTGFVSNPISWGKDHTHLSYRSAGPSSLTITLQRYDLRLSPEKMAPFLRGEAKDKKEKILALVKSGAFAGMVTVKTHKIDPPRRRYTLVSSRDGLTKFVQIEMKSGSVPNLRPLIGEILASYEPFHQRVPSKSTIKARIKAGERPGDRPPDWLKTVKSTGSGSIVTQHGHVLSNHHVVEGCARLSVFGHPAFLLGTDVRTDLALLQVPHLKGRDPVRFRRGLADLGSQVFVLGYPVFGVSQSLNMTSGIVSSRAGLYGDRNHIQITAPVQGGNSGGPVLSASGAQIGVVVAKPSSELTLAKNLENIAWIVRGSVATRFLEAFGVRVLYQSETARIPDESERAKSWPRQTVRVECHE